MMHKEIANKKARMPAQTPSQAGGESRPQSKADALAAAVVMDKSTPPYGSGIMEVPTGSPENFIPFEEI